METFKKDPCHPVVQFLSPLTHNTFTFDQGYSLLPRIYFCPVHILDMFKIFCRYYKIDLISNYRF